MFEIIGPKKIKIGTKVIDLPCSIGGYYRNDPRIVEFEGLVLVNFYPYTEEDSQELIDSGVDGSRNIWAFDQDGNKLWEVVSAGTLFPELNTSYTYLSVKDGKLIGGNWVGYDFEINSKDGSIKLYPENPGRPW